MFRLRTLGGAWIEGPQGPLTGAASQKRRLAVLALLGASAGGVSRDRVYGLLWPESSEERARHSLAQVLYGLRRELGGEVAVGGAAALRLDRSRVSSDVLDLQEALERGDAESAVTLYAGPFLDGFHLSGCPEFERWVEEERSRLHGRVRRILEAAARSAESRGTAAEAVRWWGRLAALEPLDGGVALALMKALAAVGDRAGAIRHARTYETLLRAELGIEPHAAVLDLAAELAAAPAARPVERSPAPAVAAGLATRSGGDTGGQAPPGDLPAAVVADAAGSAGREPPPSAGRRLGVRRAVAVLGAVGVLVLAGAGVRLMLGGTTRGSSPDAVIVADVENVTGEPIFDHTVSLALEVGLRQSPLVRVVSHERIEQALERARRNPADTVLDEALARDLARREGVPLVLVPTVGSVRGGYELAARFLDPASGEVISIRSVRADAKEAVIDALDALSRRLRRALGESPFSVARKSVPLPRVSTHSLAALELYAEGSRAFDAGSGQAADSLWLRAVALDPGFATAWAALGVAAYWSNRRQEGERHFVRALALIDSLPEAEQALIRARVAGWRGHRDSAIAVLEARLKRQPRDFEALQMLSYNYLRADRFGDAAVSLRRILAQDSTDHVAWLNLATAEKERGLFAAALEHYGRAFELRPDLATANNNIPLEYASALVHLGMPDSAAAAARRMLAGDAGQRARGQRTLALLAMYRGRYGEAAQLLRETLPYHRASGYALSEMRNRLLLATSLGHLGRTAEQKGELDSCLALARRAEPEPVMLYWIGKALARAGYADKAAAVQQLLDTARVAGSSSDLAAARALRGEILLARGRGAEALPQLRAAARADSGAVTRESLAFGLGQAGRLEEAAAVWRSLADAHEFGWEGQEATRLAPYQLALLYERERQWVAARQEWERFIGSWQEADSALPLLRQARMRLAAAPR